MMDNNPQDEFDRLWNRLELLDEERERIKDQLCKLDYLRLLNKIYQHSNIVNKFDPFKIDEVKMLHPAVMNFLEDAGWLTEHHVKLESKKIVDVLARKGNQTLIVECKIHLASDNFFDAVGQVLCYCSEYGYDAMPAFACPASEISDYAKQRCKELNIELIELPLISILDFEKCVMDIFTFASSLRASRLEAMLRKSVSTLHRPLDFLIAFHTEDEWWLERLRGTLYEALWGRTTSQLSLELGLDELQDPYLYFSEYAQLYTRLAEKLASDKLGQAETVSFAQALEIVWHVAKEISKQAKATSKLLGMDLVTEKPLLSRRV